jgi:hypothetical protein
VLTWTGNWVATFGWNMTDKRPQQEGDYLLAVFVSVINAGKMGELGISLLIGGQWLSGQLVAARDWFEGLGAYLDRIPMAGALGEMVKASGMWAYPPEEEHVEQEVPNADDGVAPKVPIGYLHLRDAQVISAADPVPTEGGYVRIRIESIDGWMLGRLGPPGFRPASPNP